MANKDNIYAILDYDVLVATFTSKKLAFQYWKKNLSHLPGFTITKLRKLRS